MFRFTIRDVLWLTTLAAVLVAWCIDHTKTRIDWAYVREVEQDLQSAKKKMFFAESRAEMAWEQKASIVRAAALRGITQLDMEPETRIVRPFDE
jgi:hypothetical protein